MNSQSKAVSAKSATQRDAQLWISVKTSSAVEGIRKPFEQNAQQLAAKHAEFVNRWRLAAAALPR